MTSPVDTLRYLCKLGLKSEQCNRAAVEEALAWLNTKPWYLIYPTLQELDALRQVIDTERAERSKIGDAVRVFRAELRVAIATHKRERDSLTLDFRQNDMAINEAELRAKNNQRVMELEDKIMKLKDKLDDNEAALEVRQACVKSAKERYYLAKNADRIISETGG